MSILPVESMGVFGITNSIQGIAPPASPELRRAESTGEAGESMFGSLFKSLIQNVKDTDAEFVQTQYLLATGQLDNPAQIGLAAYKNEIAVDLLIQLRNKALDAYSELTRLSI